LFKSNVKLNYDIHWLLHEKVTWIKYIKLLAFKDKKNDPLFKGDGLMTNKRPILYLKEHHSKINTALYTPLKLLYLSLRFHPHLVFNYEN